MRSRKIKVIFIALFFITNFLSSGFPQENIYGDYLIASIQKTVSLDLKGARLIDVLKMLSRQVGLNFISTEAVQERTLTLYLEGVPLKEAMDIIFKANGLAYDYFPEANIFVIKEIGKPTIELKSKIYKLKYARLKDSNLQEQIKATVEAGVGSGIVDVVKSVLSEFGKVAEDAATNSLIVVDIPSQFPIVDQVVAKLDLPRPKVMIEVEMLDVSKTATDRFGVRWAEQPELLALNVTGTRSTNFPFGSPFGGQHASSGGDNFALSTLTVIGQRLALQFFKSNTDTKTLARPKILTLSDETAEIKITTDEVVGVSTETDLNGSTTANIERVETGTSLRVTPRADIETGEVTLAVEMVVRAASDSGFTAGSSSLVQGSIRNPEERSTKSVTRLKDGETLLIGGLIKKDTTNQREKVPILGNIPFLGRLFRWKGKDKTDRELLVFLTPHIIKEGPWLGGKRETALYREQVDNVKKEAVKATLDELSK